MSIQSTFESAWYGKAKWVWLLFPLAVLFGLLSALRRWLYQHNILSSSKPKVPVIVVGNISVGGNGKTPIVIAVAEFLDKQGYKVGVLSRGYKGSQKHFPHTVSSIDSPATVGDEPFLIFNRLNCVVAIDPIRARGAKALQEIGCDVIVCDDGLQHYALQRDIELVVMDERQVGNGYLLPMGPLRERTWRLNKIHTLICNGNFVYSGESNKQVSMHLSPIGFVNLAEPTKQLSCDEFARRYTGIVAACAIGNPQRFYDTLAGLDVSISRRESFADHHHYIKGDLPNIALVMTEKDAVKCRGFAHGEWWYLKVAADLPDTFYDSLTYKLTQLENL